MLHEILIEYPIDDLQELAESKGIDVEHKSRGDLIRELLNLDDGDLLTVAFDLVYRAVLQFYSDCRVYIKSYNVFNSKDITLQGRREECLTFFCIRLSPLVLNLISLLFHTPLHLMP